jgi:conjugative relaxase-like TrwC/TraI family protein
MLSVEVLKSAQKAFNYYMEDNYYTADQGVLHSTWWGKAAEAFGLTGQVDPALFGQLLRGQLPNGQQLGFKEGETYRHRPGYDLTFAPPKSVSLMGALGNDRAIVKAHQTAVQKAMRYVEIDLACYRETQGTKTTYQPSGNLLCAFFDHDISREGDPHYHTHVVVLNATLNGQGRGRALGSQSKAQAAVYGTRGFGECIFAHKKYYGALYRAYLAIELRELGYALMPTHSDLRFEIAGVSDEIIQQFSKRRQAIEKQLNTSEYPNAKRAAQLALTTRPSKPAFDHETATALWLKEAEPFDVNFKALSQKAQDVRKNAVITHVKPSEQLTQRAVDFGIQHLSEREAVLSQQDLVVAGLNYRLGEVTPEAMAGGIETALAKKTLLPMALSINGVTHYTTPAMLAIEKEIDTIIDSQKNIFSPIWCQQKMLPMFHDNDPLTADQRNAALMVVNSSDRFMRIQGHAGTGKTTVLKVVNDIIQAMGMQAEGVAVSAAAALQLKASSGIASQTLAGFLRDKCEWLEASLPEEKPSGTDNTVPSLWVIDEASMVSSRHCLAIVTLAMGCDARVLFLGDHKQLSAIEAGKPFSLFEHSTIETARLTQVVRQASKSTIGEAVSLTIANEIEKALQVIGDQVVECEDRDKRLQQVAAHFLKLPREKQLQTLVMTPANSDREVLNQLIREGLQRQGIVSFKGLKTAALNRIYLSSAEKGESRSYQTGDVLFLRLNVQQHPWHKPGAYYTIQSTDHACNLLELRQQWGEEMSWHSWGIEKDVASRSNAMEVYRLVQRELAVGDVLRWTRNDKKQQRVNGQLAEVIGIDNAVTNKRLAQVRLSTGDCVEIDFMQLSNHHWEYAYVRSVYSAQGQTADHVIAHDQCGSRQITHQKAFYVTISRARCGAHLYIDSKEDYAEFLKHALGEKTSAIEFLQERIIEEPPVTVLPAVAKVHDIKGTSNTRFDQKTPKVTPALQQEASQAEKVASVLPEEKQPSQAASRNHHEKTVMNEVTHKIQAGQVTHVAAKEKS